jgi:HEAT repeat protein
MPAPSPGSGLDRPDESDDENQPLPEDEEVLWLRERLEDEELEGLFSESPEHVRRTVRRLIERAREDVDVEARLIDALEVSLDDSCDDTQASVWMAIILGEAGSRRAIGLLSRGLSQDDDELLQDACRVALLRVGTPAVAHLVDALEEDDVGEIFQAGAFEVFESVGWIGEPALLQRVIDFLVERFAVESKRRGSERSLERIASTAARLGCRSILQPLRRLLGSRFHGHQPILEDAIALLEENSEGVPILSTIPPWEERYGWLFVDDTDRARVHRPSRGTESASESLDPHGDPSSVDDFTSGGRRTDSRGLPFQVPGADQALEDLDE